MADKICFVISPIGEPESEIRKHSDHVFNYVITPAVQQFGYDPLRVDQIAEPGLISSQVIQHIVNDPLVVADLTGRNPNVFYELGLRHALRSPLVQIIQDGEQIPFDVAGTRTIYVDHRDLDSVANAKEEIVKQVAAIEKNPADIQTPISVSIDLQDLKKSDNPEQRERRTKGIFISYRRDEGAGYAGRIADSFTEQFGEDRVFRDIDAIEPGLDFAEAIESAVGSSEVLIAVIGKNWLTAPDAAGRKRLEDANDYVRTEIVAALKRNIRVIPLLVQGASMPSADELPDDLAPLARRNAFELHDTSWRDDVRRLTGVLKRSIEH